MRTIIAGSRDIGQIELVENAIAKCGWEITQVVCGKARGVDTLGEIWAKRNRIPVAYFPADWDTHGKQAGHLRNEEMAKNADALIAVWDNVSRGTEHMIRTARHYDLSVYVYYVKLVDRRIPSVFRKSI